MTTYDRDKIIAAAKEAGIVIDKFGWTITSVPVERMEALYAIANEDGRQAEREDCAKECEDIGLSLHGEGRDDSEAYDCADAIRARGDTK